MKNNYLEYKGYHTVVEFDKDAMTLYGKIEGINDYVDFQCVDPAKVETEFHKAVDDYLAFCEEVGKKPEKEYKGSFNIRIEPVLHKELAVLSDRNGESINSLVEKAIRQFCSGARTTI